MDLNQLFQDVVRIVGSEFDVIVGTVREKGANRFARPLIVGGLAALVGYQGLYVPSKKKLATISRQVSSAQATAKYADEYLVLRDQIRVMHAGLPPVKDKDAWLFDRVREVLVQENLVAENLAPPLSFEGAGVAYQKMTLSLTVPFPQLSVLIQRLEAVKPFVHISMLEITKRTEAEKLGTNLVNFEIMTVVPMRSPG